MNFLNEPNDGWQPLEKLFLRQVILMIYRNISDPIDRFILVMTMEAGYTQDEVGAILLISQPAVAKRLNKTLEKIRCSEKAKEKQFEQQL